MPLRVTLPPPLRRLTATSFRSLSSLNQPRPPHLHRPTSSTPHPFAKSRSMSSGMSTAPHPVSSTSDPAPPAEGIDPLTPGASATTAPPDGTSLKPNGDKSKEGKDKQDKQNKSKEKKDKKGGGGGGIGSLELSPPPEFFAERIKIFDEYKAKYDHWVSGEWTDPSAFGRTSYDL